MEDGALQKQYQPIVGNPSPRCVAAKRMATTVDDSTKKAFGFFGKKQTYFHASRFKPGGLFLLSCSEQKTRNSLNLDAASGF